jgi:hypothetical protein
MVSLIAGFVVCVSQPLGVVHVPDPPASDSPGGPGGNPERPLDVDSAAPARGLSALDRLPPETAAAARQRARFVFRLPPDDSIWDGSAYVEFRRARQEAEAAGYGSTRLMTPRALAWGFARGRQWPAQEEQRPHPLWTSSKPRPLTLVPSFLYINESLATTRDRQNRPIGRVEAIHPGGVVEFSLKEYPAASDAVEAHLPRPWGIATGWMRGLALLPSGSTPDVGGALCDECFLIADNSVRRPLAVRGTMPTYRMVPARLLRLSPEEYGASLLAKEAVLVEWSFTRTSDRGDTEYVWTRRELPIECAAGARHGHVFGLVRCARDLRSAFRPGEDGSASTVSRPTRSSRPRAGQAVPRAGGPANRSVPFAPQPAAYAAFAAS